MHGCMHTFVCMCAYVRMYVLCIYVCIPVSLHMDGCRYVCPIRRMYASIRRMHACMYVCMYACYVHICVYAYIRTYVCVVCVYVCIPISFYVCTYGCMSVCMSRM
jgi:hypothetical protein